MKPKNLYLISFIEGGVVMVTELAGAKILTPFFGASLYSWASTLSITLFALMTGYYTGGYVTTKSRFASSNQIIWVFLVSGLSVLIMPTIATFIMQKTISFSFFSGLIISELLFLFFPIFLMGMISPLIIFQITKKAELSGRSAGNIYAISTSGGILFTLVFGFIVIPNYGISLPLRILGLSVAALATVFLIKDKLSAKKFPQALFLILLVAGISFNKSRPSIPLKDNMKLLEYSEGLLGELKVTNEHVYGNDGSPTTVLKLRVNNIPQNYVFANLPTQSLFPYVNFTRQLLKHFPKKESALLIGLGAGSLFKVLKDQYAYVETVEIDKRIYDFGVKYFGMLEHKEHFITDGRYYINSTKKKYDLIIVDVIIGESIPAQLITLESFRQIYKLLNTNGTLIIEHGGVKGFTENAFVPSIYKTLTATGFQVNLFNPLLSEKIGDVMFVATKNPLDVSKISLLPDVLIKGGALLQYTLPITLFDYKSSNILTDDKNNLDVLLKSHYFEIRKSIRKELASFKSKKSDRPF
ncbi:fused MFS/spermidine synthase [Aurantibacillus circumpalustris]|uniref:fused MFS/spermidine synthase n=1 Tax=Aurantibacillus circumpalustris TaxID=3036359 RepID=UPI00295C18F1|nr:fused MFS/spermidine synthase [Aurantibacillus circumpalustris]